MKTYREIFSKLASDLAKFDSNELIIVTYDKSQHLLQFNQMTISIMVPNISPYFIVNKKFKVGVLTQNGLNKLRHNLQKLLRGNELDDLKYTPDMVYLGTDWYRCYGDPKLPTPEKVISLNYCNVRDRLMVWILCKYYNDNSRILYKLATKKK